MTLMRKKWTEIERLSLALKYDVYEYSSSKLLEILVREEIEPENSSGLHQKIHNRKA